MKKRLGVLILTLAALVAAAACASSGKASRPLGPESLDNWASARHVTR